MTIRKILEISSHEMVLYRRISARFGHIIDIQGPDLARVEVYNPHGRNEDMWLRYYSLREVMGSAIENIYECYPHNYSYPAPNITVGNATFFSVGVGGLTFSNTAVTSITPYYYFNHS